MKERRLEVILELIEKFDVDRQETLQNMLNQRGFNVTQATVSRDIKTLRLVKIHDNDGNGRYVKPSINIADKSIFSEAIIGADYAMNTVVLKCRTGMAQAACASLDSMKNSDIVGTLAGDDTIFILMRSEKDAAKIVEKFILELNLD